MSNVSRLWRLHMLPFRFGAIRKEVRVMVVRIRNILSICRNILLGILFKLWPFNSIRHKLALWAWRRTVMLSLIESIIPTIGLSCFRPVISVEPPNSGWNHLICTGRTLKKGRRASSTSYPSTIISWPSSSPHFSSQLISNTSTKSFRVTKSTITSIYPNTRQLNQLPIKK